MLLFITTYNLLDLTLGIVKHYSQNNLGNPSKLWVCKAGLYFLSIHVCLWCSCVKVKQYSMESALFPDLGSSGDWTQVVKLNRKHHYQMSHLVIFHFHKTQATTQMTLFYLHYWSLFFRPSLFPWYDFTSILTDVCYTFLDLTSCLTLAPTPLLKID